MDLKLRIEKKKKGWKWYLDEKKKGVCIAIGNFHYASRKGAKRGFDRFVDNVFLMNVRL